MGRSKNIRKSSNIFETISVIRYSDSVILQAALNFFFLRNVGQIITVNYVVVKLYYLDYKKIYV